MERIDTMPVYVFDAPRSVDAVRVPPDARRVPR